LRKHRIAFEERPEDSRNDEVSSLLSLRECTRGTGVQDLFGHNFRRSKIFVIFRINEIQIYFWQNNSSVQVYDLLFFLEKRTFCEGSQNHARLSHLKLYEIEIEEWDPGGTMNTLESMVTFEIRNSNISDSDICHEVEPLRNLKVEPSKSHNLLTGKVLFALPLQAALNTKMHIGTFRTSSFL
jgi:hypothetical protein